MLTRGAEGIGVACSKLFARQGANIVVSDVAEEAGLVLVTAIKADGGNAIFMHNDMGEESPIAVLVRATIDTIGRVDTLYLCSLQASGRF